VVGVSHVLAGHGGGNGNGDGDGDPVPVLVGFTATLRHAGLAITTDRVAAFLTALDELDVTDRQATYWAGRLTLCADPDDVGRYDSAFRAWFERDPEARGRIVDQRRPPPSRLASLSPEGEGDDEEGPDAPVLRVSASAGCWRCCGSGCRCVPPGAAARPGVDRPTRPAPCARRCATTASCASCAAPVTASGRARWCC
jgi:hypothetical protein